MTDRPRAIICDLDGTLALLGKRNPYNTSRAMEDALNHPVANIIEVYDSQNQFDIRLILLSGREEKFRPITEAWLRKYGVTRYDALYLRSNKDRRKDYIVKREIYENKIKDNYDVTFVLEDRDQVVKMWRTLNIPCFQVDYGNF